MPIRLARPRLVLIAGWVLAGSLASATTAFAQAPTKSTPTPPPHAGAPPAAKPPTPEEIQKIQSRLDELNAALKPLKKNRKLDSGLVADVEVYAKAAEWCLRHGEFYTPKYVDHCLKALETGLARAKELADGKPSWVNRPGISIRGYYSKVDGSVQPYAIHLPEGNKPTSADRHPLHVHLHGRGGTLNEVSFIAQYDGKPLAKDQTWVQLEIFGRTNNAYRWAGETDVFEAMNDLRRTVRIDDRRIVLRGFSMGGAGAWHLGLHHPSKWCSVGPGAGFIDFYKYQKVKDKLPAWQDQTLGIYDSVDYALNAFNVPVCTYGGELDEQLVASTAMVEAAKKQGVDIKLLIGPGVGHKFHPETEKEFMKFHIEQSQKGRPPFPGRDHIRFTTRTLKYNECEWLTIEEMLEGDKPATVEAKVGEDGVLKVTTENVAVLQIARDVADRANIDGSLLPLRDAAQGLLPGVYFDKGKSEWFAMDYNTSREFSSNPDLRKRRDLQGPIDDAFMGAFVCVRGTKEPWHAEQKEWSDWTLARFEREFDKWMRGKVPVIKDSDVPAIELGKPGANDDLLARNLILFGDPGSNSVLKAIVDKLPIEWTKDGGLKVNGQTYDPKTHGVSLIYPNPLNPRRYVVINSGHTFHERDFKASNAWLFPRLGDIAVQKFSRNDDGSYKEETVWATNFNPGWRLPE